MAAWLRRSGCGFGTHACLTLWLCLQARSSCSPTSALPLLTFCPPLPACSALPACPLLQTADQRKELNELREMKEDVERREKAQAEVISQQVGGVGA